jgi:magnesium-transporting ATPase (P-type)
LARTYDGSNPVTLAIGDGANDVGMIQEAQIGVGISGLEGQQAVNASDFAIAQFRFLEELLLIHGRWNFMRMSKVVLFSFYKNAVLVALLVCYSAINLYSGTTLFDQWVTAAFNFVCGIPIIFLGCFDRDLEKDYVKKQSIVYMAGPNNEHLSARVSLRWAGLVLAHTTVIYSICASSLLHGGGMSSAFRGFMLGANENYPGDGEGDNWKVYGTTIILVLIFMLAYKVRFDLYCSCKPTGCLYYIVDLILFGSSC